VRVKDGDFAQGTMKVVVLRSYYQNNPPDRDIRTSTLFVQDTGPTLRPNRNAITPLPVTARHGRDETPPPPPPQ